MEEKSCRKRVLFCRIIVEERSGNTRTHSACDAWGNILSANGTMAGSLGTLNPLRYRSYVYDHETGLYYLQSRYYDPELGRFINANVYASTGQGLLGNNMFAYCNSNPIAFVDYSGNSLIRNTVVMLSDSGGCGGVSSLKPNPPKDTVFTRIKDDFRNFSIMNKDVEKVYEANYFSAYKGALVLRHSSDFLTSWSIGGIIFLNKENQEWLSHTQKEQTVKHEYGHTLQYYDLGAVDYMAKVFIPSATYNLLSRKSDVLSDNYYNMPWERDADIRGGVERNHAEWSDPVSYFCFRVWG